MNNLTIKLSSLLLCSAAFAQNVAIFPDEYVDVPEGPFNSFNLPFAKGVSRAQCLYDTVDIDIPSGNTISKIGFREDGQTTFTDNGVAMQIEIRMGWSTYDHQSMTTNFDNNYDAPPVTVFGPAIWTPPNLRDPANPLPNGELFITLDTPFSYVPAGRNLVVEYRITGTANGGAAFTYRLDRADFYSPISYGAAGCMHSGGGVPNHVVQPTRPGLSWSGSIQQGPANAPAFLAINVGLPLGTPFPLSTVFGGVSPTCTIQMPLTNTELFGGSTSSNGSANWSFVIPNDNIFADMTMSSQVFFFDFFSPGQIVISNGAEVKTGVRTRCSIVSANGQPASTTTGSKSQWYGPVTLFEHN